jgi:hypothetical protein
MLLTKLQTKQMVMNNEIDLTAQNITSIADDDFT